MDGESAYMAQLRGGVGKGLFCSPGLSWAICFAAARLLNQTAEEPGAFLADAHPLQDSSPARKVAPARATIARPEAGGGLVLHVATESNLMPCKTGPRPTPWEEQGRLHTTVLQKPDPHIG